MQYPSQYLSDTITWVLATVIENQQPFVEFLSQLEERWPLLETRSAGLESVDNLWLFLFSYAKFDLIVTSIRNMEH